MQLFKKYGIDITILVILVFLLALLLLPWSTPSVSSSAKDSKIERKVTTTSTEEQLNQMSAGSITALFGVRPVVIQPSSPTISRGTPAVPETVDSKWIKYTGRIKKDSGIVYFYFKNTRTNRIIELNPDGSTNSSGWRLLAINGNEYTLHDGKQKYIVRN